MNIIVIYTLIHLMVHLISDRCQLYSGSGVCPIYLFGLLDDLLYSEIRRAASGLGHG